MDVCHNPGHGHGPDRHEIPQGARRIRIPALTVEWGDQDVRDDWTGGYVFCSFQCLADWAAERAADHDGHVLVHGEKPKGDEPDAG